MVIKTTNLFVFCLMAFFFKKPTSTIILAAKSSIVDFSNLTAADNLDDFDDNYI
jgi:hypothetical protein